MFGLLYPRSHSGLSNLTLRLNYVLLLALIGVWLGYIFDDGEDEGLRTAVIAISAAFSGVVFLVSFGETIYGKFMETPLEAAQMPTSENMGMRYFQRLPFSPLFTRGASLIYLIATTVYLAYGNAINDTSVVNRDPTSALTEVERGPSSRRGSVEERHVYCLHCVFFRAHLKLRTSPMHRSLHFSHLASFSPRQRTCLPRGGLTSDTTAAFLSLC